MPTLIFLSLVAIGGGLFVCGVLGIVFDALRCIYLGITRKPRRPE